MAMAKRICTILISFLIIASACAFTKNTFADTVSSKWVDLPQSSASKSRGLLHLPDNNFGDLPAVLLIGDCSGPKSFQRTWAHFLASQGYVTFLLDPASSCNTPLILIDAAKSYLKTLPLIKIDQIAVINWASHPFSALDLPHTDFAAAVSFYPNCSVGSTQHNKTPLLILATDQTNCSLFVRSGIAAGIDTHMRIYPDAKFGFDDPNAGVSAPSHQPKALYNLAAHQDSIKRVQAFLNKHLQVTLAAQYPSRAFSPLPPKQDKNEEPHITYGNGTWTHDPSHPGSNKPPVGRSIFDRVFSESAPSGMIYKVPNTYEDVIKRLSKYVSFDRRGRSPIKQSLVPRGRSLQREAARPNYYHHPRIVVAVDGEPPSKWKTRPVFIKDRIFLGYQEAANVLEVISYNEAASRFEFQVVKNFGPGLTPITTYADRRLCTSCHQNGAPLFPREDWQETSAARETNKRLQSIMNSYHGVPVGLRGEIPAAIDISTDRANLLPVLQRLWKEGCGLNNRRASNQCRAAAFEAMLLYRLSNDNDFDRNNAIFKNRYTNRLKSRWRTLWPGGLYISNSDIPDRDPTIDASISGLRAPLTPRPPMEIWSGFKRSDLERMIIAFADDLPTADIKKLDQWMVTNSTISSPSEIQITAPCTLTRQLRRGLKHPLTFQCKSPELELTGAVSDWGNKNISGQITYIRTQNFANVDQQSMVQTPANQINRKTFKLLSGDTHMRLSNGHRLSRLTLALDKKTIPTTAQAQIHLVITNDFNAIQTALAQITASSFSNKPFHGPKLMSALFGELGIKHTDWCCDASDPGPPIDFDIAPSPLETINIKTLKPKHLFTQFCARCHRTNNAVPPNFLSGDKNSIAENINHCAPRMAFRLSMWDHPVDERSRSPMPPESALSLFGLSKTQWRNSPQLAALRAHVSSLVGAENAIPIAYDTLRSCLKPSK